MKNRILYAFIAVLFIGVNAGAQTGAPKIGFTSTEYILSLLPAAKEIQKELSDYNDQLSAQMKAKEKTFQEKFAAYQQTANTMTELIKKDKERELQSLEASLRQFQQDAQTSFADKQQKLLEPLLEEIRVAIQKVAEENNFTHILNSSTGGLDVLLYAKEEYDVSNLVLAKLGVQPPSTNN
ncbi:OmpH family outer membrane protein [Fulvivirgaceae bacterium BMA12]|uniref:OmpH family outer membrane protein n=1 Tax=Agaribacillus aureus TaxID=3051825 RepID=A0ABT8L485_9BACT|nr:OmpH family outer membrane protein [Fulvivirgaceae bacterium BMA12]